FYFKENRSLPAEVVVYRSGASEGEFDQVKDEARDIHHNGGKSYRPRITVIVVITPASLVEERSDRFRAAELNVPSGTCVDTDIVNRHFREFIMTSQQANIGTSRPVRYTVVVEDKPERPLYEVEHMTHFLCHGHQQSTLPTRIPGILFAAENLAKRGRASWITVFENSQSFHSLWQFLSSSLISLKSLSFHRRFFCAVEVCCKKNCNNSSCFGPHT
uniref:Piwi domain-containing protein n=1 Tax=Angiostrongylus cantonensis TaxID=6313 RepID=A0A0K0CXD5_ANGCA